MVAEVGEGLRLVRVMKKKVVRTLEGNKIAKEVLHGLSSVGRDRQVLCRVMCMVRRVLVRT